MSKSFYFRHFGCRLNYYEGISIISEFLNAGWEQSESVENAHVAMIHSCTVTSRADYKVRSEIRKIKTANKQITVYVLGCFDFSLIRKFPDVFFIGNRHKSKTFDIIRHHRAGNTVSNKKNLLTVKEKNLRFDYYLPASANFSRAYVKVQDGCSENCSYCKIPQVRGRSVSRDNRKIIEEIRELVLKGFHEIVLTGVNTGDYQYNGMNFTALLKSILSLNGDFYIRISSIEPKYLNTEAVEIFSHEKMAAFLHVPIQSASEKILLSMNRPFYVNQLRENITVLRKNIPGIFLGTDVLVGYPLEDEREFTKTLEFIKEMDFAGIHVFPFSPRERTRVCSLFSERELKQQNGKLIKERIQRLVQVANFQKRAYIARTSWVPVRGIVESGPDDAELIVLTENYLHLKKDRSKLADLVHLPNGIEKKSKLRVRYNSKGEFTEIMKD